MKVLYIVPDGDDLGGIYTSTENLLCGFREAGHSATLALIRPSQHHRSVPIGAPLPGSFVGPGSGWPLHPIRGWKAPYYSWGDPSSLAALIKLGNEHDLVVWGAMFGLRNRCNEGNDRWVRVFSEIKRPHVAMIRDDHLQDRYSWVTELERWIVGWACVQQSSLDSCAGLRRPRALISSGHDLSNMKAVAPLSNRKRSVFSLQTFKSWKRVDRLVSAAPYLKTHRIQVTLAGDGIERCYMSSHDKCKPRYYCTRANDPDAPRGALGQPIWQLALKQGMAYRGSVTPDQRDQLLRESRFFVDLSYREHSTGQINRTVVEAIKQGCVPLAIPKFISGTQDGRGRVFVVDKHYLQLDHEGTPLLLAQAIADYCDDVTEARYRRLQSAGRELIQQFSRKVSAQRLVALATGKAARSWCLEPRPNKALLAAGKAEFRKVFGGKT